MEKNRKVGYVKIEFEVEPGNTWIDLDKCAIFTRTDEKDPWQVCLGVQSIELSVSDERSTFAMTKYPDTELTVKEETVKAYGRDAQIDVKEL